MAFSFKKGPHGPCKKLCHHGGGDVHPEITGFLPSKEEIGHLPAVGLLTPVIHASRHIAVAEEHEIFLVIAAAADDFMEPFPGISFLRHQLHEKGNLLPGPLVQDAGQILPGRIDPVKGGLADARRLRQLPGRAPWIRTEGKGQFLQFLFSAFCVHYTPLPFDVNHLIPF